MLRNTIKPAPWRGDSNVTSTRSNAADTSPATLAAPPLVAQSIRERGTGIRSVKIRGGSIRGAITPPAYGG